MTAFLTRRCREPIAVEDVAAHVSLHPHYAMRLFRKHMGMSIIDYLTRQRVAEVQRRLLTSDEPLLSIAHQSGFGSASRFHQAFRRLTGTTPDRFRRQAAGALEA
jgi:transcriptional regulator GlxA family with amidase domain